MRSFPTHFANIGFWVTFCAKENNMAQTSSGSKRFKEIGLVPNFPKEA
jgi:hypothetical protein